MRVGVEGGDRRNALEHAGGLLPGGSQLLAVPAPRREELNQHHPVRVQHLQPNQNGPRRSKIKTTWRRRSGGGGGQREASQTFDLKLLGSSWRTGEPAE